MNASILTIGDEILNGTTVDTNSAFIAQKAAEVGLKINQIFSVSDTEQGIFNGLEVTSSASDIVFITGGLGPTKDDITLKTLAKYFNGKLILNEEVFTLLKSYFEKRGSKQVELNKKLALLPDNCTLVKNERGTAQGMWFEKDGKIFVSMPGVPFEMKHMFTAFVLPKIIAQFELPQLIDRYVMTAGIGESSINAKIEDIEDQLEKAAIKLAYLPSLGSVKLRLTSTTGNDLEALENFQMKIAQRLKKYVFGFNEKERLENVLGYLLKERKETISTAESCTGGFIAHKLTSIAGSSAYFEGSLITYSYEAKIKELKVLSETLEKFGAVSEETVKEMLTGLLAKMNTTYGIAVSGIAGPGGGTPDKPVGTVWMALGTKEKCITRKFELTKNRILNIQLTSTLALNYLRRFIKEEL